MGESCPHLAAKVVNKNNSLVGGQFCSQSVVHTGEIRKFGSVIEKMHSREKSQQMLKCAVI